MRRILVSLLLAVAVTACAGGPAPETAPPAPSYAPAETVTVRASAGEVARRLVALYASDGITVAGNTGGTITTAPVMSVGLSAGSGANGATGTADYFYRATVAGDSVSVVTLALWGRVVTRAGTDPASPAREVPIAARCASDPKCAPYLERMKRHADALRGGQ